MANFGWSLPPGVSRLPGEDVEEHPSVELLENLVELCPAIDDLPDAQHDAFVVHITAVIDQAYSNGYNQGAADAGIARAEEKIDAKCPHEQIEFADSEILAGDLIIHVICRTCGRSGASAINTEEVQW